MSQALQDYYLQIMGIDRWVLRSSAQHNESCKTSGNPQAKLMIVGETLEKHSTAFFNQMLASIGLTLDDVFLLTFSKSPALSTDILIGQIEIIQPEWILSLGEPGAQLLKESLTTFEPIPLITIDHPSDLLNNPGDKKQAYRELLKLQAMMRSLC